jgi:beta-N-acetylhexosaminidase
VNGRCVLVVVVAAIAGCLGVAPVGGAAAAVTASPIEDSVSRLLASLSEAERVGQLFMAGGLSAGNNAFTISVIRQYHVGSVILNGNSRLGVSATRTITDELQAAATGAVQLLISADQEGGQVQRLHGPGFSEIPSALQQGRWKPDKLRRSAATWASQLAAAGVNVNLAPVLDVVPAGTEADNPPIGWYDRQYGSTPEAVAVSGTAFAQGMNDGGVVATGKHFPGLGRVTANTDTSGHVVEAVTTRGDAFLQPFAAAIAAGLPMVMMSSAYYALIDPDRPAAFSPVIVTEMLRGDLGFPGLVISDSIGAVAFSDYPVAQRAVNFIAAGGDIVLAGDPSLVAPLYNAVLAKAGADPAFAAQVDAAAMRVLREKARRGLIPSIPPPGPPLGHLDGLTAAVGGIAVNAR